VIRSRRDPPQAAAAIKSTLRGLDRDLPAYIETWDQQLDDFALCPSHVAVVSLGVMGAMLSITGIFGLAAYSVSKWLKELGIRRALGAQRKQVLHADLGRAFKLLACGSATGLVLGILASRVLAHIVYQATPRDPVVLAGVFLATALLGLWATWIPAQRALSLDEDYSCNKTGWVLKALHVQLFSADQQVVVGISPRGRRVTPFDTLAPCDCHSAGRRWHPGPLWPVCSDCIPRAGSSRSLIHQQSSESEVRRRGKTLASPVTP
jgi:hypothetical protein